jgi:hypothetical protein
LCFVSFSSGAREFSKPVVSFLQPARFRRLISVRYAPGKFVLRCFVLMEKAGELRVDDCRRSSSHLDALMGIIRTCTRKGQHYGTHRENEVHSFWTRFQKSRDQ